MNRETIDSSRFIETRDAARLYQEIYVIPTASNIC